jgi:hypothetical protein
MRQKTEVEFLEEIQTEVLRVFLLAIHRHLCILTDCTPHLFFGLEISTSNSWEGGGEVSGLINTWINEE